MNIFDRIVAGLSPAAGARRAAARLRTEQIEQARKVRRYAGASRDKRLANWNPGNKSADSMLNRDGSILRARAYDMVRNNGHAANIVSKHTDYVVGDGLVPKVNTGDSARDAEIKRLWGEFSRNIDPQGILNFDGLTRQMVRGMIAGGEMIARRRARRLSDGFEVPLQIQVLEAEFIDTGKQAIVAPNTTARSIIVSGIEFGLIGDRRGYWLYTTAPSNDGAFGYTSGSKFVPASEVIHLYEPLRAQVRGETWLAPILTDLRDLDEYDFAEMQRKKTEACLVAIVTDAQDAELDDANPNLGLPMQVEAAAGFDENGQPVEGGVEEWPVHDVNGDPVERFEPGMIYRAASGSTVEFNTPATSAGYDTYIRTQLRKIAAGARMPYEVMTGDLSNVTFASGKMGRVDYQRFIEGIQWNLVIPVWCDRIWGWFIDTLILNGQARADEKLRATWQTPVFQTITPIDDVNADKEEVRSGFAAWDDKVIARGYDPDEVARKIVARNAFWDQNNVVLDTDPRRTSKNGQLQGAEHNGEEANAPGEQDREAAAQRPRRGAEQPPRLAAVDGGKAGR